MTENATATIRLETRLARLETIVSALEREELELEDALALFEEGIGHLRGAREAFREGELRIERLLEDASGELVLEALGDDDG